ncbi:Monopolin complex subunit Csm1/Pcs1 C-terminal domain-containing protein [Plasmodiophora brassicae]|uniref:Uncharacterized protein n=1 Tax=Plasmodiophora brassicae TaxID=37360 RepID=A0A0G4IJ42_PLABS|nr:hypothetical protein PBRA_004027 [Plasmodiophora brassicae]SPQ96289.1 unnamed protein product [Plasmodiophora brassicae]
MARTKSAKLAPSSVVVADDAGTSTSKRQRLAEVAGKGDDFVAELNVRRELKLLIKEKDAEYADLLAKYNALKESTLSQLNNSIDRLGSELDKLQSADTEPVIEHLQAEIASLNDQLQAARKAKLENVMLKNETTALHSKVKSLERKLNEEREAAAEASAVREEPSPFDGNAEVLIEMYRGLTGMRIIPDEGPDDDVSTDDPSVKRFICRAVDNQTRKFIEGKLVVSEEKETVSFTPTRFNFRGSEEDEERFSGEMEFGIDGLPRFTKVVLKAIQNPGATKR